MRKTSLKYRAQRRNEWRGSGEAWKPTNPIEVIESTKQPRLGKVYDYAGKR